MYSMTGYGASRLEEPDLSIFSEIRGVNGRHLQIKWNTPSSLNTFERHLEGILRKQVKRGQLKISLMLQQYSSATCEYFNTSLAKQVLFSLNQLKQDLGISGEIGFDFLARVPGVFENPLQTLELREEILFKTEQTFCASLEAFQEMRSQEGTLLKQMLLEIVNQLENKIKTITERLPQSLKEYHQKLLERIQQLLQPTNTPVSESDLLRELAIIAERCDVTEELDRLTSHIEHFRKACKEENEIGKKLEFIAQEFHREINTLGNKMQDKSSILLIPEMKLEVEKLKEQCQNIE